MRAYDVAGDVQANLDEMDRRYEKLTKRQICLNVTDSIIAGVGLGILVSLILWMGGIV